MKWGDSIWKHRYGTRNQSCFHMKSYGIPCAIYTGRDSQRGQSVNKLQTNSMQQNLGIGQTTEKLYLSTNCATHLFKIYLHPHSLVLFLFLKTDSSNSCASWVLTCTLYTSCLMYSFVQVISYVEATYKVFDCFCHTALL